MSRKGDVCETPDLNEKEREKLMKAECWALFWDSLAAISVGLPVAIQREDVRKYPREKTAVALTT